MQSLANAAFAPESSIRILESRSQYRSCHLQLPDLDERLPGISVGHSLYSFLKSEQNQSRALEKAENLSRKGDHPILTKTPKGYVIWVLEPDAQPLRAKQQNSDTISTPGR
jgi:hypothetical protein